jgi:hypothetical protein
MEEMRPSIIASFLLMEIANQPFLQGKLGMGVTTAVVIIILKHHQWTTAVLLSAHPNNDFTICNCKYAGTCT